MNIGQIALIIQVMLAFIGAYLVAVWFAMVVWTYYDIRARSPDIYVHIFATALTLVFHVFGLVLYYVLRPRESLAEAYERSLAEEALLREMEERQLCPSCHQRVDEDFLLCPYCHQHLKRNCPHCKRLLHLKWELCPHCGQSPDADPLAGSRRQSTDVPGGLAETNRRRVS